MAKPSESHFVSIDTLAARSPADRIRDYANAIPDGKAIAVQDAASDLDLKRSCIEVNGRAIGLLMSAVQDQNGQLRRKNFLANPKTVKAWQEAQKTQE